jgi:hypothetical protein
MTGILIVDDDRRDAAVTQAAVTVALRASGKPAVEIQLAHSMKEGLELLRRDKPRLVITDLFMPQGKLDDLMVRCDEMEFPHGFRFLRECSFLKSRARRLVSTLYWNYPGFARYADISSKLADGAIPKDIFYAVGTLRDRDELQLKNYEDFPPMRVLVVALDILLADAPSAHLKLHLQSLYEDASAYLRALPDTAAHIRKHVFEPSAVKTRPKLPRSAADEKQWTPDDLAQQMAAGPWLPMFSVTSSAAREAESEGGYAIMMKAIAETEDWRINVRTMHRMPKKDYLRYFESNRDQTNPYIPYYSQGAMPIEDEQRPFLSPKTRKMNDGGCGDRALAQLLLTLGFFTNWCHIRKYQHVLTAEEIAAVILQRTKNHYRDDQKSARDQISRDLEALDWLVTREIMRHDRAWYQYFKVCRIPVIDSSRAGQERSDTNYRYKLNGSVRLFLRAEQATNFLYS